MSTSPERYSPGRTEFIALMALSTATAAMSIDAMLPALGQIGQSLNAEGNQVQLIVGMLFLGAALGQLVSGILSDSIGRRTTVFLFVAVFLLGTGLCIVAQSMTQLLLGRMLQGFGAAGPQVVAIAIIRDRYEGRQMAQILSFVMSVFILVPVIAPLMGQGVLLVAHWRAIFVALGCMGVILAVWFALRQPETLLATSRKPLSRTAILGNLKSVLRERTLLIYTGVQGLILGAFIGYLTLAQPVFQGIYQLGAWFPVVFAGLSLALGAGSMVSGNLVLRIGMHRIMATAFVALSALSVCFALLLVWVGDGQLPLMPFLFWLVAILFFEGLAYGNIGALALESLGDNAGFGATVFGCLSTLLSVLIGTSIGQFFDGTVAPLVFGYVIAPTVALALMYLDKGSPWGS